MVKKEKGVYEIVFSLQILSNFSLRSKSRNGGGGVHNNGKRTDVSFERDTKLQVGQTPGAPYVSYSELHRERGFQ